MYKVTAALQLDDVSV